MKMNLCCFFLDSAVLIFIGAGAQVENFVVVGVISFETEDSEDC